MSEIYTIGYGDKDVQNFLRILDKFSIERVVDVRRFPSSKQPGFSKGDIEPRLNSERIDYVHLGNLGGYRDGGYEEYMKSDDFAEEFEEIQKLAEEKNTAIMCLESNPSDCHRRFISRKLKEEGWKVIHIVGKEGKSMMEKGLTDF